MNFFVRIKTPTKKKIEEIGFISLVRKCGKIEDILLSNRRPGNQKIIIINAKWRIVFQKCLAIYELWVLYVFLLNADESFIDEIVGDLVDKQKGMERARTWTGVFSTIFCA